MENTDPNIAKVQRVAKSSSDQLLRKFAEVGSDHKDDKVPAKDLRLAKRVKRKVFGVYNGAAGKKNSNSLSEKKSLLAPTKSAKLGISKGKIRSREMKSKSIITALEKTWRKTVEGASRVLMEKHYNRHKRLTNDSY